MSVQVLPPPACVNICTAHVSSLFMSVQVPTRALLPVFVLPPPSPFLLREFLSMFGAAAAFSHNYYPDSKDALLSTHLSRLLEAAPEPAPLSRALGISTK